ncbi:uncharacterized protein LOC126996870 [Eriocheir sinensis]|uniref:uncharacterized protein LOC126996870 n=1 Tax=Eriocheir sinensis TaxID=95602 RepID=UPI0021C6AF8E|nr:uncharacterized protein LOC126996870 [Eriocheir sinensis]
METPVKLRNNYQSISLDTQSSPEPPELILPHTHGGSLLLQGGGQRAGGRVWACNWLLLAGSAGVVSTHPGLHLGHQHRHHLHRCQSCESSTSPTCAGQTQAFTLPFHFHHAPSFTTPPTPKISVAPHSYPSF